MNRVEKNIQEYKYYSISVVGLGRSGMAAAHLAKFLGAKVLVNDFANSQSIKSNLQKLNSFGINGIIGGFTDQIYNSDVIVISPGVPADSVFIKEALQKGMKVISEIEFASLFTNLPIVGVTGTNGKSTTVHALTEMCQSKEINGVLAGNIGTAFSEKILEELQNPDPKRVYILEISSFQLEFIDSFHPYISVFLNITQDHLDRHKNFKNYLKAKLRLAENQTDQDYIIYNSDDQILVKSLRSKKIQQITFSLSDSDNPVYCVKKSQIINRECAKLVDLEEIGQPGQHNLYNLLAAASAAHCLGISDIQISNIKKTFKGIPHRLEKVAEINGVEYINDSKATNIDAVKVALDSFPNPIVLILGGKAKGNEFAKLKDYSDKVKRIIAYGAAKELIYSELQSTFKISRVGPLKDAINLAHDEAILNDIVLLSPGCASFDQFKNFEERGEKFAQWVGELVQ